ncbi:MAG: hypothetical protein H6773_00930 [Pseudomonadales bacterium]|nr:hypothetical protein [Candidatus Woesebacteria bacterium]MCB9800721.1 hypothetical protein [Pseudomonadales bacterium]
MHELIITHGDQKITYSEALLLQGRMQAAVAEGRSRRKDAYGDVTPPAPIRSYSYKDVRLQENGSYSLKIELDGKAIMLPLLNVGSEENPAFIAMLNPSIPEIADHGSSLLAEQLKYHEIDFVIAAPSSKSETMITEATVKATIQPPMILLGGSENRGDDKHLFTENEVQGMANGEKVVTQECRPITLAEDQPSKFFGVSEAMIDKIILAFAEGKKIAIVDDVYSSGATITSIKKLLTQACLQRGVDLPELPIIVVAQEEAETSQFFSDPEELKLHNRKLQLHASILLPVLFRNY